MEESSPYGGSREEKETNCDREKKTVYGTEQRWWGGGGGSSSGKERERERKKGVVCSV